LVPLYVLEHAIEGSRERIGLRLRKGHGGRIFKTAAAHLPSPVR